MRISLTNLRSVFILHRVRSLDLLAWVHYRWHQAATHLVKNIPSIKFPAESARRCIVNIWSMAKWLRWCGAETVRWSGAETVATVRIRSNHDDVIKWKHLPRYWPFVREVHRSPANSPHKGQWRGALMFSLICVWLNGWVNNGEAGDLRRYRAHYDVTVMCKEYIINYPRPWVFRIKISDDLIHLCIRLAYQCMVRRNEVTLKDITSGNDVIMNAMAYQITCVSIVCSTACSIKKLRVTGLCGGNPPVTGGFPSQRPSNEENASIWWRHHEAWKIAQL